MELLDRYLEAVRNHLPWLRQDDILAELRANLEAQLEDRQAELGRPLTNAEVEAWLKELGPPMQVASRYQPLQYLIGPALFPMYWYVLRMAAFWATAIYLLINAILILVGTQNLSSVAGVVWGVPGLLMTTATWVTLVFAGLEFGLAHYPEKFPALTGNSNCWTPAAMPAIEKALDPRNSGKKRGKKPPSYAQAVAEVIFGFIGLVWLLLVPQHPFLLMGPGATLFQSSPFLLLHVWTMVYWFLLMLSVVQMTWRSWSIWSGSWRKAQPIQNIVFKTLGIIPAVLLLSAPDGLFALKHPILDQPRYGATLDTINRAAHQIVLIILAIVTVQLVWEIAQDVLNSYRSHEAAKR